MKFLPADTLWSFITPDYFPQTEELILALEKEQINFANPVRFIAIPVNFANTHWTVAIIDRELCTIRYFDSAGAEESLQKQNLIGLRLEEARIVFNEVDGKEYCIDKNENSCSQPPSRQQYDGWNCACYMFLYAHLATLQLSEKEIDQLPLDEILNYIVNLRQRIITAFLQSRN